MIEAKIVEKYLRKRSKTYVLNQHEKVIMLFYNFKTHLSSKTDIKLK